MANEIRIGCDNGFTIYALIRDPSNNKVWDYAHSAWDDWADGDVGDYDVPLTYRGGGYYEADLPEIGLSTYDVFFFEQVGDSPHVTNDVYIGYEKISGSDGDSESAVFCKKILANKAIQNKNTGVIAYYDDDGETIILTHTPSDGESSIARTPS